MDFQTIIQLGLLAAAVVLLVRLTYMQAARDHDREEEKTGLALLERGQERLEKVLRDEISLVRRETSEQGRKDRTEQQDTLNTFRSAVEKKLEDTLTRVHGQMNIISKGLGEMNQVASSVSDLKKIMSAVSSRGAWGEARLEALLADALAATQYERNSQLGEGTDRVEFSILLPGAEGGGPVRLPLDSKFPVESYQRLLLAQEKGEKAAAEEAAKALEGDVKRQAKKISKYISPPATTDFALMFLPSEGLYLEVLRRPGVADAVRQESRVAIVGPSTVTAFLMSLRMGFATLAIQTKSLEVWETLTGFKKEFARFEERVDVARDRLAQADKALGEISTTVGKMEKKLRDIETPAGPEGDAGPAA